MIVTVTLNPAVDRTVTVEGPLIDSEVTRIENARFDAGGKGINVSKYLTAMDVDTVATGVVGGFLGEFVVDSLEADGVRNRFVHIDECTRLNSTIHTETSEYKLNQHGPNVTSTDIDEILSVLSSLAPETVVVGGSLPPGLDSGAIDRIASHGPWDTAVDVGGDLLKRLDSRYTWCKPNLTELETATGREISSVDDAISAAKALQQEGFKAVIASLGAEGAVLVSPETVTHEPSVECDVVDTVGAGDALLSGFLAGLAAGEEESAALETGVVTASTVVSSLGTTVPTLDPP